MKSINKANRQLHKLRLATDHYKTIYQAKQKYGDLSNFGWTAFTNVKTEIRYLADLYKAYKFGVLKD